MNAYMAQFERLTSLEAYEVAKMAKAKGLVLLEGFYKGNSDDQFPIEGYKKGFCVAKVIAGQYLTLADDNSVFQARVPFDFCKGVYFDLTLAEAKERIMNFDGTIKNPPNFFAYVRLYDNEPKFYGPLQILYLEEFARRHRIEYKRKFVYLGGTPYKECCAWDKTGIDCVIDDCNESFSLITKNDFLVVSDIGRIDNQQCIYSESYISNIPLNIIALNFKDMGYAEYHKIYEIYDE